ncbi:MAG: AsmA-like C-terminal region-containing protein [Bryobacteraceae bacterium]
MTRRRKRWLIGIAAFALAAVAALFVAAAILAKRFEPMVRDQAVLYLRDRFHCDVQLASLHVHLPKMSTLGLLLKRERGARLRVDGTGLVMRLSGREDLPPLFSMRKFRFEADLQTLTEDRKIVDSVSIEGLEINVPPKQDRVAAQEGSVTVAAQSGAGAAQPSAAQPSAAQPSAAQPSVLIEDVRIKDAVLVLVPRDKTRKPVGFQIASLRLTSVGAGAPMNYDAALTIPKPSGQVHSQGVFGPWETGDPGATPLNGIYTFNKADLGVFNGIAGILSSTGRFDGSLAAVHATGEASVPDFRLKMTGNRVPLWAQFEALIDGTNGNTVLQPVRARLGKTAFTTTGTVIRHEQQTRRSIDLQLTMPGGDMRDLLRLATRQPPFMEGRLALKSTISIPPLSGKVKEKLVLDGTFQVSDARFLKSHIQDQLDQLSRRAQGQPGNREIDQVVSNMSGAFHLENQAMTFRKLSFGVPGAVVNLTGVYDMGQDTLDFHGTLKLVAKISEMMTGWKHWALKPVDPFFEKNGAGTFLRIRVGGSAKQPSFGLDHQH